ncbi:hypothetical protein IU459_29090 [Nocardia amamiensis]|uniref:Uncharacterized protein n=1 Tax=Nocardia amamiensis TaxID=404578 RepID=A0ABS0CY86_9NOCA|nr:hypothetical protein [Nocardia amamiensis]MBF6301564.1 hypothetical protein [Nocardia amamiensis]
MAENRLHIHAGNKQKAAAGTPFPESCVVQVTDSSGAGVEGVEVCFTLRGSAAPVFPSPPSPDGIRWHAVTSSAGLAATIPVTPYFAGTVEVHVTAEMFPGPDTVDFHLAAI